MLNLLIALMGDIFDKIQENAKAEFMLARAEIVLEFETKLSESNRKDWMFPKWLQILAPEVETKRTNWEGKVRDLKENVNEVQKKLEDSERKRANSEKERKKAEKSSEQAIQRMGKQIDLLVTMVESISEKKRKPDRFSHQIGGGVLGGGNKNR